MHGKWLILIELLFVFSVVMLWGLNELRQLRRYRRTHGRASRQADDSLAESESVAASGKTSAVNRNDPDADRR